MMRADQIRTSYEGDGVVLHFRHRKRCPNRYPNEKDMWGVSWEWAKNYELPNGGFKITFSLCGCSIEVGATRWRVAKAVARLEGGTNECRGMD